MLETINIESKQRSKNEYGTEEPEIKVREDGSTKQVELVGEVEEVTENTLEDETILNKVSTTASSVVEEF